MSRTPLLGGTGGQGDATYLTLSDDRVPEYKGQKRKAKGKEPLHEHGSSTESLEFYNGDGHHGALSKSSREKRKRRAHHRDAPTGLAVPVGDLSRLSEDPGPILSEGNSTDGFEDEAGDEYIDVDGKGLDGEDPIDNSPFPQVRASVAATDDTKLSINTPRMWVLSLLFAFMGSATNLFFSLRYPSVAITPVIALVLVHPMGRMWDALLKFDNDPECIFEAGTLVRRLPSRGPDRHRDSWIRRFRLWLSQGSWNEKEHAMVYIGSNVSFSFAFATDVIVEQAKFYHQDPTIVYQLLLIISTQILGYSFAGLTRRYLVRPPSMIWPGILMSTAMFTTMHKSENKTANGWTISRYKFFVYIWGASFAWYFLPGLLFPALSYFSAITWIAPDNVVISNLFGVVSGLGLFPLTFDWAMIAYIGSPLLTPWWAAANVVGGLIIVMWILAPILYYRNALYSSFMPILSSSVFDNTGKPYNVSKILTSDFLFDRDAYLEYSPVYLPITYVLSYTAQFASLSALVTHTACWHGKDLWEVTQSAFMDSSKSKEEAYRSVSQGKSSVRASPATNAKKNFSSSENDEYPTNTSMAQSDVHSRLMSQYDDVPAWWYLLTFVSMLMIGIFVVEYYPEVHLPWYGLLLALSITALLFIPVGIVMAITNQHSSLYLICQLICGAVFPGRPVANMIFVTYCYISSAQGIKFSSDLKLGHYMKIPPKQLFAVQMAATLVSSFTQIGVLNWMFANIKGICTEEAVNGFICPLARVHFNGSILWGVVGPQRFFGPNALYRHLVWAFLVGAIAPIIIWILAGKHKGSLWRKVNLPVVLGSLSWIPPATGLNFSVWALVCFIFNYIIRRRAFAWWGKYTMTMSAALDSGLAFAILIVFFGFVYPGWSENIRWWGTEVYKQVSFEFARVAAHPSFQALHQAKSECLQMNWYRAAIGKLALT
ncbi:hypothetical protein MMC25_007207 [Agyrium rufum]|nr:hypothetical protein [Agyrium rufum]